MSQSNCILRLERAIILDEGKPAHRKKWAIPPECCATSILRL